MPATPGKPGQKPGVSLPESTTPTPAEDVRALVRLAMTASLASLDQATGHPYASLVLTATTPDGTPLLLISRLARHTRNILGDPRASLLFDGTQGSADPLAGGRATLIGHVVPVEESSIDTARRRFLARHPEAEGYADFADFGFYALRTVAAHYVGGFGRIVELQAADILLDTTGAEALLAAEADFLARMNADHAESIAHYATARLGQPADSWRMSGIDPDGADLTAGRHAARLSFAKRVMNPDDARRTLADLAGAVQGASPRGPEGLT